jgi:anti-sigma factor RsiW
MSKHPSLKELNEYACGSLDESRRRELAGHIDSCPRCTEEVEESRMFDSAIRVGLKLTDGAADVKECLSPDMLPDYYDGYLAGERFTAAERHLAECPSCRKSLIEMRAMLEQHRKGELADLNESASARALSVIAAELEEQRDSKPALLICMACRQPIPTDSRFCSLCGAATVPPKKDLAFLLARRQSVSELIRTHVWLVLSLSAMGASFFFERYFVQCVTLALIFGAKWILDQAQFRIYRDILKSLKSNTELENEGKSRRRKAL